ncbi:MAG: hypothetical protein AAGC49_09645 [Brevundimonas sp.]
MRAEGMRSTRATRRDLLRPERQIRRLWRYHLAPVLAVLMLCTSLPLFVATDYLLERSFWFLLPLAAYVALVQWMANRYLRPPPPPTQDVAAWSNA